MEAGAFTPKLITALREGYPVARLRADLFAGLTVAIVALPLAMALGIASGASPREGLVTAVVAGFLISALGGSRVQVGGPTGAFVVIVAGVIAAHGFSGLLLATFMAGLMLIVAGYAGVGRLMRFVPMPVVTGFTAGIAVIIATSQVADFMGLRVAELPSEFVAEMDRLCRGAAHAHGNDLRARRSDVGVDYRPAPLVTAFARLPDRNRTRVGRCRCARSRRRNGRGPFPTNADRPAGAAVP